MSCLSLFRWSPQTRQLWFAKPKSISSLPHQSYTRDKRNAHLREEFWGIHEFRSPIGDPPRQLLWPSTVVSQVLVLNVVPSAHYKHVGLLEGSNLVWTNRAPWSLTSWKGPLLLGTVELFGTTLYISTALEHPLLATNLSVALSSFGSRYLKSSVSWEKERGGRARERDRGGVTRLNQVTCEQNNRWLEEPLMSSFPLTGQPVSSPGGPKGEKVTESAHTFIRVCQPYFGTYHKAPHSFHHFWPYVLKHATKGTRKNYPNAPR